MVLVFRSRGLTMQAVMYLPCSLPYSCLVAATQFNYEIVYMYILYYAWLPR